MTEEEFRALLAIEGYTLNVDRVFQRRSGTPKGMDMFCAEVIDEEGCVVQYSNWYTRKWYAVQALIRDYYEHD